MSVIIQGMEVPEGCYDCRMLEGVTYDGLCHAADKWLDDDSFLWYQYPEGDIDDNKPINCPLIEMPDGHWIQEPGKIPKCSVCGKYSDDADTGDAKCCPFCGARMDGE